MKIQFKDRTVRVSSLHQWHTYEGLLEGVPHDKMNQRILEGISLKAVKLTFTENYFLVEPEQTPIDIGRKYPFGEPMSLPEVICVAGLKYLETSNPEVGGISVLTLISFQDYFAPPLDKKVLEAVAKVNWFAHAMDISYDEF